MKLCRHLIILNRVKLVIHYFAAEILSSAPLSATSEGHQGSLRDVDGRHDGNRSSGDDGHKGAA